MLKETGFFNNIFSSIQRTVFDEYIEFRNAYLHQKSIIERKEKKAIKAKTIAQIEKEKEKITYKLE